MKKKVGRPSTYNPLYCRQLIDFFSPPHYLIKDITITKSDGTRVDKTVMEACPPVFLSDFARSINVPMPSYRNTFRSWAKRHLEFAHALKVAKELEEERIRVNASMGLYNASFSIFTLKNIAGWRDTPLIDQSEHTHFNYVQFYRPEPKSKKDMETSLRPTRRSV